MLSINTFEFICASIMMSQAATDLLMRHPGLVVVETDNGVLLNGIIENKGKYYNVKINCPNFPKLKGFSMLIRSGFTNRKITEPTLAIPTNDWTVNELISNLETLSQNIDVDKDKAEMCKNVKNSESSQVGGNEGVERFYAEIAALHQPNLYDIKLNIACTLIRFCKFSLNDQHFLEIELPSMHIRAHSLPACLNLTNVLSKCNTLTEMIKRYRKIIEDLQPFYDNLMAIDELCHVLQPAEPTTKHNFRLFKLRENVFLKLVIADPFAPLPSMKLDIIGPTTAVEHLRGVYSEGLKNWDADLDMQQNLLRIFDLCYFPMPPEGDASDEQNQTFCNICYSYRLKTASVENFEFCDVPVVSCDNPQCTLVFHDSCLLKWFRTLADDVSFLNVRFGDCPFCKAKLSASFEQLRYKT